MSIQITQTGGAGAAVADKGLSGAWLDVPITVTLSNVGMNAYEHAIEDQTTGLEIAIATGDARIATFTPSGNRGSFRIRSGYREQSYSPWRYTYRVIRVERDSTGANYAPASPALEETPSETAEDRGYAEKLDEIFSAGVAALATVAYSSAVDLTSSGHMVYDGENNDVFLAGLSATSGFTPGTQVEWFVPAGTATAVVIAEAVDPGGALASLFNIAEDFTTFITATSATTFVASAQSRPPVGAVVPTFTARVTSPALSTLVLTGSEALQFPVSAAVPDGDITGVALGGTMAVPRTIVSVAGGNGTLTPSLALSGALSLSDTPSVVVASNRAIRAMNGPRPAAGSVSITMDPGVLGWVGPGQENWWRADQWTLSGTDVLTVVDQQGADDLIASATRPQRVLDVAGSGRPGWKITGAGSYLEADFASRDMTGGYWIFYVARIPTHTTIAYVASGQAAAPTTFETILFETGTDLTFTRNQAQSNNTIGTYTRTDLHTVFAYVTPAGAAAKILVNGASIGASALAAATANISRWTCGALPGHTLPATDVEFCEVRIGRGAVPSDADAAASWAYAQAYYTGLAA